MCFCPILVPHAITIKASNNREIYIIGEYVEDIEIEATYRQIAIPPSDIHCTGGVNFTSPFLRVSHHVL